MALARFLFKRKRPERVYHGSRPWRKLGRFFGLGLLGSAKPLESTLRQVMRFLCQWLNRRNRRRSANWAEFRELLQRYQVE